MPLGCNRSRAIASGSHTSRYLIHDRATIFMNQFRRMLRDANVETIRLPARSPNLNAYAERFVGTIRQECLGRPIFFGDASLRRTIDEFIGHCNEERNHQGLANKIIRPEFPAFPVEGAVANASADYCATTTAKPRKTNAAEFMDGTP